MFKIVDLDGPTCDINMIGDPTGHMLNLGWYESLEEAEWAMESLDGNPLYDPNHRYEIQWVMTRHG